MSMEIGIVEFNVKNKNFINIYWILVLNLRIPNLVYSTKNENGVPKRKNCCFLEVAIGASATVDDFDSYDQVYASITTDAKSVYLYHGMDEVLFKDDIIVELPKP